MHARPACTLLGTCYNTASAELILALLVLMLLLLPLTNLMDLCPVLLNCTLAFACYHLDGPPYDSVAMSNQRTLLLHVGSAQRKLLLGVALVKDPIQSNSTCSFHI